MIRFKCPHCQTVVKVGDGTVGKRGVCPSCGERFIVPPPDPVGLPMPQILDTLEEIEPDSPAKKFAISTGRFASAAARKTGGFIASAASGIATAVGNARAARAKRKAEELERLANEPPPPKRRERDDEYDEPRRRREAPAPTTVVVHNSSGCGMAVLLLLLFVGIPGFLCMSGFGGCVVGTGILINEAAKKEAEKRRQDGLNPQWRQQDQ